MSFKPNKLTAGFNLVWESSRMMLSEHINMLHKMNREKQKKVKPEFDEQYLNELALKIAEAKQDEYMVEISVFNEYEDIVINGKITYIDHQLKRLKVVKYDDDTEWIKLDDILNVEKV